MTDFFNFQSALKEKQQLSANIKLLSDEKQELEATVVKLKKFRQSVRDLLSNLLDSITNYYFVFKDMRSKDEVPEYDENNLLELNMFMDQKLDFLLSTAQTFLTSEGSLKPVKNRADRTQFPCIRTAELLS